MALTLPLSRDSIRSICPAIPTALSVRDDGDWDRPQHSILSALSRVGISPGAGYINPLPRSPIPIVRPGVIQPGVIRPGAIQPGVTRAPAPVSIHGGAHR